MDLNINKNISVWRGDTTPPTEYHLWIKTDGTLLVLIDDLWVEKYTPKTLLDNIEIVQVDPSDDTILTAYELHDAGGNKKGVTINIPKDQYIKDVKISTLDATLDGEGMIVDGTGTTALCISYILADGTFKLVPIDYLKFLEEAEFGDGTEIVDHKVQVKIDPDSDSYLTVGPNGVKLSGVADNFNNYLPLKGGTLTGELTINYAGSTAIYSGDSISILEDGSPRISINGAGIAIDGKSSSDLLNAAGGTTSVEDLRTEIGKDYLPLTGGALTGTLAVKDVYMYADSNLLLNVAVNTHTSSDVIIGANLDEISSTPFRIQYALNDNFCIFGGGTSDNGFCILSSGDNGNEPIYIAQNRTSSITHLITLMDGLGNQVFNNVTANGFYVSNKTTSDLLNAGGSTTSISDITTQVMSSIVDGAPETLDTLNELAAALGDDPNFATTITTQLGNKVDKTSWNTLPNSINQGTGDLAITDTTITLPIYYCEKNSAGDGYQSSNVANRIFPSATNTKAGLMSANDKDQLDQLWDNSIKNVTLSDVNIGVSDGLNGVVATIDITKDRFSGSSSTTQFKVSVPLVTTSANGVMSASDKTKLDSIYWDTLPTNIITSVGNSINYTDTTVVIPLSYVVKNSNGSYNTTANLMDKIINAATSTTAGVMSASDKLKLDLALVASDLEGISAKLEYETYTGDLNDLKGSEYWGRLFLVVNGEVTNAPYTNTEGALIKVEPVYGSSKSENTILSYIPAKNGVTVVYRRRYFVSSDSWSDWRLEENSSVIRAFSDYTNPAQVYSNAWLNDDNLIAIANIATLNGGFTLNTTDSSQSRAINVVKYDSYYLAHGIDLYLGMPASSAIHLTGDVNTTEYTVVSAGSYCYWFALNKISDFFAPGRVIYGTDGNTISSATIVSYDTDTMKLTLSNTLNPNSAFNDVTYSIGSYNDNGLTIGRSAVAYDYSIATIECLAGTSGSSDSVALGDRCAALGDSSVALGWQTITRNYGEVAVGKTNKSNTGDTDSDRTLFSVGIGATYNSSTTTPPSKNALEVMANGDIYMYNVGEYDGTNYSSANTLLSTLSNKSTITWVELD